MEQSEQTFWPTQYMLNCGEVCLMKLQLHLEMHLDVVGFFLQQQTGLFTMYLIHIV